MNYILLIFLIFQKIPLHFFLGGACKKVTSLIDSEYFFLDSILSINTVRRKKELLNFLFLDHIFSWITYNIYIYIYYIFLFFFCFLSIRYEVLFAQKIFLSLKNRNLWWMVLRIIIISTQAKGGVENSFACVEE